MWGITRKGLTLKSSKYCVIRQQIQKPVSLRFRSKRAETYKRLSLMGSSVRNRSKTDFIHEMSLEWGEPHRINAKGTRPAGSASSIMSWLWLAWSSRTYRNTPPYRGDTKHASTLLIFSYPVTGSRYLIFWFILVRTKKIQKITADRS